LVVTDPIGPTFDWAKWLLWIGVPLSLLLWVIEFIKRWIAARRPKT
jgi:hypothetical protein